MVLTNEDLLKEVSTRELQELSDFEGSGAVNQGVIDDSVNDALAYISSFIKLPQNPTPLLKDIGVNLIIIELKKRNNFPKEAPNEQIEKMDTLLLKMANKKLPSQTEDDSAPRLGIRAFRHSEKKMDLKDLNG